MLSEHGDIAEPRAPIQRHRGKARHPRAGEEVRYHPARLRERLDERLDSADRHLRQIRVAVIDRVRSPDRDRIGEPYRFRLHGQELLAEG